MSAKAPRRPGKTPVDRRPAAPRTIPAWLQLAGCLVVAFALFGSTLDHPWIADDKEIVADNLSLRSASPAILFRTLAAPYWSEVLPDGSLSPTGDDQNIYRPATIASFWLNARLGEPSPASFRFFNILLLGLTAFLVGRLAARLIGEPAAIPAMAIVVAHPLGVDVVNRITGRSELLVVAGVAAFLLIQLEARRAGWSAARMALAALAGLIAVGAKESGLMLLPLSALLARFGDAPPANARAATEAPAARWWVGPLIAAAATAIYLALRFQTVGLPEYVVKCRSALIANPLAGLPLLERLPAALSFVFYYLRMLIVPWPLLAIDVPARLPGWGAPATWLGALLLIALGAAFVRLLARRSPAALIPAWWLACYLLVGQLLVAIGTYREVRLVYPFIGALGLAAGWALSRLRSPALRFAFKAAVAGLAVLTLLRNGAYATEQRLFESDLQFNSANPTLQSILTGIYIANGDAARATASGERAVALAPQSSEAWNDLGSAYLQANRLEAAGEKLEHAVALCKENNVALMTLGVLRLRQNRLEDAHRTLLEAERLDPAYLPTQLNLCLVEEQMNQLDSAARRLHEIERRAPGHPAIAVLRQPFRR